MIATAVLITKEREYPKEILGSLPAFDEILVETECPSIHRRYELALKAKNDLVYVQDDDCITDVTKLFEAYNGHLTNAMTPHHLEWYRDMGVTLVGFGCFFTKRMIDFSPYLDEYGINDLFLSQTDRVFTYLNQPHNSVVVGIKNLPSATAPDRMSTSPGHYENLNKICEQLYNLPKGKKGDII